MGSCLNCGKKILYNSYKRYRGKVLCPECYNTRLERKEAKKVELKKRAEELSADLVKISTPRKKAKKAMQKQGLTITDTVDVIKDEIL